LPFSSQDHTLPGVQLEIATALAKLLEVPLHVEWIVYTYHARRTNCDAIIGSIVPGDQGDKDKRPGPQLSKPYVGGSYVLVVPRATAGVQRPEDLHGGKIGVQHTSWPHYMLQTRGIATMSYASQMELLDAVAQGEVAAGMVSNSYVGWYLKLHPEGAVKVAEAFAPDRELQWNVAIGLRNADAAILEAVNQALERLLAAQTIQGIFAKYGIPYVPPFTW
jgi:ABC-type amino acid transport substrate-binding protein